MTEIQQNEHPWPKDNRVYLTLDYECDYGTALATNEYQALSATDELVTLLERFDVPLTCFVQTEVLKERPEKVERLRNAGVPVEFHPHSHTHAPREKTSIEYEIAESTIRFEDFFGDEPVGYRFPNGNIRPQDYRCLAEHGYKFDASIFPSWRPNHFNNTSAPTSPQYLPKYDLFEIPFTVYSETVRIPTALSYCRLLGRLFTEVLVRRPPSTVVLNIHMHDLVNPPSFGGLQPLYRTIYRRNAEGLTSLDTVLQRFRQSDCDFGTLGEAHERLRNHRSD